MAVSKNTRRSASDTNELFQSFFENSQVSEEREREWREAIRHAGSGEPPLRFPIYEHLYLLDVYTQKLVDLQKEISGKFGIGQEDSLYHQFFIEQVRSSISCNVVEHMAGVEHTDAWLFESLRRIEEKKLRDPDDVYFHVREREVERINQGLPPRIQFLDEKLAIRRKVDQPDKPDEST
jgi:hypothetical protein